MGPAVFAVVVWGVTWKVRDASCFGKVDAGCPVRAGEAEGPPPSISMWEVPSGGCIVEDFGFLRM